MDRKRPIFPRMDRWRIRWLGARIAIWCEPGFPCETLHLIATLLFETGRFQTFRMDWKSQKAITADRVQMHIRPMRSKHDSNVWCKPNEYPLKNLVDLLLRQKFRRHCPRTLLPAH